MSKYTENFPNLSTYDFDTIMCQLKQVCGADPSGLINSQFLSRPTTAKDIALLLHITYELFQSQVELQKQFVELYTFVKDFFENLDLQEEVNKKIDQLVSSGYFNDIFSSDLQNISNTLQLMQNEIDQITNSPGSTTGDLELQNIRQGFTGYLYTSAGSAVRGEDTMLNDKINIFHYFYNRYKDPVVVNGGMYSKGYMDLNGNVHKEESNLWHSEKIPVKEGDLFVPRVGDGVLRFVTAFNDGVAQPGLGYDASILNDNRPYEVPNNIDEIVISNYYIDNVLQTPTYYAIDVLGNFPFLLHEKTGVVQSYLSDYLFEAKLGNVCSFRVKNTVNSNVFHFGYSNIDNQNMFVSLQENENVVVVKNAYNETTQLPLPESILGANICCTILSDSVENNCKIYLQINGSIMEFENVRFTPDYKSQIQYYSVIACECDLSYSNNLLDRDIWIMGDSYLSFYPERWTYYLTDKRKNLICGYAGENSNNGLKAFRSLTSVKKPKTLLWLYGMNDPDTGTVNSNWQLCLNEVEIFCNRNNVELILCTVPNTPTQNNNAKNNIVRSKGYRYIDFAKAVQSTGNNWYNGLLSDDNVHPTVNGAKALYMQAILDVPEIEI